MQPERRSPDQHPSPSDVPLQAADSESHETPVDHDAPAEHDGTQVGDELDRLLASAADDPRDRDELYLALVSAETQRDEYLDDLRRARAEFDNYRRRTAKDLSTQRAAGKADLAAALLEMLDDLDRTEQAAEGSSDEQLAQGVTLVATKLRATLERAGLERIDATGIAFDPQLHEAVAQRDAADQQDPDAGPMVAEVMRPGYRFGERVLRAAMVTVAQ